MDKQWSSDRGTVCQPSLGAHPRFLGATPLLAPFVTYSVTSCCWLFTLFSRSTVGAKFNPESSFAISRGISTFPSYFFRVSKIGFAFHDITMNHIPNISPCLLGNPVQRPQMGYRPRLGSHPDLSTVHLSLWSNGQSRIWVISMFDWDSQFM